MSCDGGVYGALYGVGGGDCLDAYLLDLLQPALLSKIRVRILSSEEGTPSLRPESAFCVVPDRTSTSLRERLRHGFHVLLWNEDHDLPQGSSRREYAERAAKAECPWQGDGDVCGGCVVARVRGVDCETVTDSSGQE